MNFCEKNFSIWIKTDFLWIFKNLKILYFAFTTQLNTLKGWGMGVLVSQAQDNYVLLWQ